MSGPRITTYRLKRGEKVPCPEDGGCERTVVECVNCESLVEARIQHETAEIDCKCPKAFHIAETYQELWNFSADLKEPIPVDTLERLIALGYREVDRDYPINTTGGLARFLDFHGFAPSFRHADAAMKQEGFEWEIEFVGYMMPPVKGRYFAATVQKALIQLTEWCLKASRKRK